MSAPHLYCSLSLYLSPYCSLISPPAPLRPFLLRSASARSPILPAPVDAARSQPLLAGQPEHD
eukprot:8391686-Pyramimonas_sp.AAC.1